MAQKPPTITVTNPKGLTEEEFKAIRGSELHSRMVKNRMVLSFSGFSNQADEARKVVREWLKENCNSTYYFDQNGRNAVYIEEDADAVNFKIALHDFEVALPEPEPVKPKPKPSAQTSNQQISQVTSAKEIFQKIMEMKRYHEEEEIAKEVAKKKQDQWEYLIAQKMVSKY